jgi:DnaB-like helicase C terminal domain.
MEKINTKENLLKTNTILDDYLKFYKSQIYLFFGKTGIGKSSLLIDLGIKFVKNGYKGIFISNQMSKEHFFERLISNLFNLSLNLEKDMFNSYIKDNIEYLRKNFYVTDLYKSSNLEKLIINDIKTNGNIDFIILDGLTNFYGDKNFENDKEHYIFLINLIDEIANKYNILVLTTSYYNERLNHKINYLLENNINLENFKISTKDLKNFEILEPILSGIIGMTDIGFYNKEKIINLQILKQRFGLINSDININFKPENQHFEYFLK